MDARVWKKVLDEIATWPGDVTLMTHGAGEPLLYHRLWDFMQEAGRLSNVNMGFMTNGMLMNRGCIDRILESQIHWLALSIDGTCPNTHDFYRVHAHLPTIEQHVRVLIESRRRSGKNRPQLHFNMVGYHDILDQSMDYVRKWLPHAASVMISRFRPVGSRKLWKHPPFAFRPCPLLHHQMVIGVDGRVGLCCEDIHLDVPLGNVGDSTLLDIYNENTMLLNYRRHHADGDIDALTLCCNCHVWGGDIPLTRKRHTFEEISFMETVAPAFRKFEKVETL